MNQMSEINVSVQASGNVADNDDEEVKKKRHCNLYYDWNDVCAQEQLENEI